MMATTSFSGMAIGLIAMFFGLGLPLGTPPEKENPVMAYAAPADCLLYATWAGMAKPNPASNNQTEQLLAEAEVQAFAAAVEKAFAEAMTRLPAGGSDPQRSLRLAKTAPLWARTLITRPAALFLSKLAPQGNSLTVEGGLIVQADAAAEPLAIALTDLFTTETDKPVEATIASRKFMKAAANPQQPFDVVWGASNGYLMIGIGAGALENLSARLAAKQEPAWLTQVKANLPIERRSTVSYVNLKQLVATFAPLGGPQADAFINALGLRQLGSLQGATGLDEQGIVSRSLLTIEGPAKGLLTLAEGKGLAAADVKHIPTDALVATSFSLDARQALEIFLTALSEVDPNAGASASDGLTQFSQQSGIDVRSALAALGSHWSLHAAAADGGWLGAALVVDVRDRPQVQVALDRLLANLTPDNGRPPLGQIFRTPFGGQTILHFAPRGMEVPFLLPSWCLSDKQLIFGLNPQAVKSVLLRQPADKSLADLPEVAARLSGKDPILSLSYYDTPKFFETTYMYAQILLPMASQALSREGVSLGFDSAQLPAPRTIAKHLRPSVSAIRRTKLGIETDTRQTLPGMNVGASAPVAVALLLPAVQAARESARRMQSSNHLKQIALGLHNHHDVFNAFPAAYSCKEGKPLLSWRVAILPFIEQKPLYDEFHQDEPWDSEHNKKLLAKMPAIFRSPNSSAKPGMTTYLGVGGKQGVLAAPIDKKQTGWANGIHLAAVTDGTSNTLMVVEASDALAVEWTKPEEWMPNEKEPLKGLLGTRPNGFLGAFADGSVRFLAQTIDPEMLKRLYLRDDGQPVNIDR